MGGTQIKCSVAPLSSPRSQPGSTSDRQPYDSQQQEQDGSVESSNVVVQMALEDSLSETLEKEVLETRKMVSALQVVTRSRLDQSMEEVAELKVNV
ncbi:hypothetical protein GOODEAATRI_004510 [Goodea atripinnis]|uniref:Uncharacterized protein n=1 Tax=Goodea atripinnis TaxID=208336 RepID=A0ABV0NHG4_9TELE